jgi:hypothetical protein
MNKIYLDKLCEFIHTTHKNYNKINKDININEQIELIKQNSFLNQKVIINKYNYIELSNFIKDIEYDQLILLYPLCFNVKENYEWYSLLNALLIVLNNEYLYNNNILKKVTLETFDKTFRKKITIIDKLNNSIIENIAVLINIKLFIFSINDLKIYNSKKSNIKNVIIFKINNEYYPILNWNEKIFNDSDNFIKYLLNYKNNKNNNSENNESENNKTNKKNKKNSIVIINDTKSVNNKIDDNKIDDNKIDDKNYFYEEVLTNDNNALFISEAIDNKESIISSTSKKEENKKKIKKNSKDIFVINDKKDKNDKNESIFNNSENKITKEDIIDIKNNLKSTLKLNEIQGYAIKLSISIINGSTKIGKPKNKTKSDLINDINNFIDNLKK